MTMNGSRDSVWQLCDRLRAEKLLVSSEVDSLRGLHTLLNEKLVSLGLLSWNNGCHQVVLNRLLASHPLVSPTNAAFIAAQLDAAQCIEAYRRLGHHHSTVERLLLILHGSPLTVAELLHAVDHTQSLSSDVVINAVFSLIYGNAIFPSDERALLQTLSQLVKIQVVGAVNPRLVIRKGTAVFPRLYRLFNESLFASKIFLTSALHDSVMLVLCQDEIFLDIDPGKSPLRFPAAERARRFGDDPTNPQYHKKVADHRKVIVEKLVLLAHNFIKGIGDSLPCFPQSLIWLVKEVHSALVNMKGMSGSEATLICSDMIVTNLLCPAIANPETVGVISDTPISHIARFNLMQIGQVVQTLALSRHEPPPPHFQLFTNQFRESPICTLVDGLLSRSELSLDEMFPVQISESNENKELFRRQHFIGSLAEVNTLVSVMQSGVLSNVSTAAISEELSGLSRRLPPSFQSMSNERGIPPAIQQARQSRLKNFADKVQTSLNSSNQSPSRQSNGTSSRTTTEVDNNPTLPLEFYDVVLFQPSVESEALGLVPEDSFMEGLAKDNSKKNHLGDGREKRARFVDEYAGGSAISDHTADNASDLEEEAAEQDEVGSVSSSQEAPQEDRMMLMDEDNASTLPDNVSDVGGMSGRASPSLSGRDTPLSQANTNRDADGEGAEQDIDLAVSSTAAGVVNVAQRNLPPVPVAIRKQNAEGLEEKFGKFTVPTADQNRPYRDDQRSLLSDSWSTNVVASDDEGSAAPALPHLAAPEQDGNRLGRPVNRTGSLGGGAEDRSDTWSLDAIASDSEADGGRERERRVRDVQDDAQEQENADARAAQQLVVVPEAQLIDLGADVVQVNQIRRQISGSSVSEVGSSSRDNPLRERRAPQVPRRLPNTSSNPSPESRAHSTSSSPLHVARDPLPLPPDSPGAPGPSSSSADVPPARKRMDLFKGLQRVGDKVRKGMTNTPLRQLPHSSTLSDLLGELSIGDRGSQQPSSSRMTESRSENRIADMDRAADDILAKYQKPSSAAVLIDISADLAPPNEQAPPPPVEAQVEPYYSPENLTRCRAFLDAKRKLRLVLGSVGSLPATPIGDVEGTARADGEREQLVLLLRTLLAEAINGRKQVLSAHIREVMRCLQVFDGKGVRKLLRTLRDEHRRRTSYVLYLQHSRLAMLRLLSSVDNLSSRIEREKVLMEECLVDVLIRFYLENKDGVVRRFLQEFSALKAQDEKTECLSRTLSSLFSHLPESSMWKDAPDSMQNYARRALERVIMGQIHVIAFYPNQEADRLRDDLLHKALSRLSRLMTPDHPMMRIPPVLHGEAPWPSAQAEINIINAYKSARDKLSCIVRCCETISNLVSMAPGVGAAAADDVTPVLVYVLIQANPPALFSNVQYVQSFGGALLDGAEGYWWTQFTAAIEFIKTLL